MATDHNVLEEVLGLERSDLESLSRWQLAALATEVLEHLHAQAIRTQDGLASGREVGRIQAALALVDGLRRLYD